MFIHLTYLPEYSQDSEKGDPVAVNVDQICYIEPCHKGTGVCMHGGARLLVAETQEVILTAIWASRNPPQLTAMQPMQLPVPAQGPWHQFPVSIASTQCALPTKDNQ